MTLLWQNPVSYDKIIVRWGIKNAAPIQFELGGAESADCRPIRPDTTYVFMVKGGISRFLGGFNYSDWTSTEWRSPDIAWSRSVPSDGHEKVAPNTSPTSWYTAHDKVQHIAYVGDTDQQIHECFFHTDGEGGWKHNVPSLGQEKVAPNTSPTSWYTAHENVQHIAYVGSTDQQIHELFFLPGGTGWLHSIPSLGQEKVAPSTSPASWVTAHDKVQHIAYVGSTDQQIHECFFHTDGEGGWKHNVPSLGQEKVAPNTSPTSWYTTPENVQHIAYVGSTDQQIHELFFLLGGTGWLHGIPSLGHEKVAPNTSPTSWYTTPENVQHIAYVGSNHDINQCFFFVGGFGGWHHEVSGAGRPKVAPGTSPTSWYTTPENVQHIAYVGNNADIHELFFFVRVGGDHIWHHKELIRSFVAPGTSLTSWYTTPENVQHIAYVGADRQIHELFYFVM